MKLTDNTIERLRHFEKMIDRWAWLLHTRRGQFIRSSGREYHLNTIIGLREAGGRHDKVQWR